ncbi:hypothetical protein SAMN06264364_114102 [Quadrisphaera granulorum]|uniref:Uncharacterized protein n=1 Tax=Quadrisphaera granulorum TaxID=317664 RepID=A0A316ASY2_9ACTN|nr:hypothetical protein BXY45_114102 [Quadrisphaera granulorum]SZE97139.1 hypothetical protein SAMN06264364_114102 [Quadrisphaera granulorum]
MHTPSDRADHRAVDPNWQLTRGSLATDENGTGGFGDERRVFSASTKNGPPQSDHGRARQQPALNDCPRAPVLELLPWVIPYRR